MKRPIFSNEGIYHVYNRGVEKRNVFLRENDYLRFIVNLYEFNNTVAADNFGRKLTRDLIEVRLQSERKELLVEILAFVLMPNHYHLMIRQRVENGVTEFMRKLGTGYTNYFNLKYDRVGPLFQGKFKAITLEREAHFAYLPHYIHSNPLELIMPKWREKGITDKKKVINFLSSYRWSSLLDYSGIKNFPSVTEHEFLVECIGAPSDFLSITSEWIQGIQDTNLESIQGIILE